MPLTRAMTCPPVSGTRSRALGGLVRSIALGGLALALAGCGSPAPTAVTAASPAPVAAAPALPPTSPPCAEDYTGTAACVGEVVEVARVLDPATILLTDGRRVRLAGVVAPAPEACVTGGAVSALSASLVGHSVSLVRPLGFGSDEFGNLWGHVMLGTGYAQDLGVTLARMGAVGTYRAATGTLAAVGPAYAGQLDAAVTAARQAGSGQFAPACNPSPPPAPAVSVPRIDVPDPVVYEPDPTPRRVYADSAGPSRHTGQTGHPCLPGERDGDHDGYCGEHR